jgi:lipoprotein-anchoring transpeptidase ErfK/SrfK
MTSSFSTHERYRIQVTVLNSAEFASTEQLKVTTNWSSTQFTVSRGAQEPTVSPPPRTDQEKAAIQQCFREYIQPGQPRQEYTWSSYEDNTNVVSRRV